MDRSRKVTKSSSIMFLRRLRTWSRIMMNHHPHHHLHHLLLLHHPPSRRLLHQLQLLKLPSLSHLPSQSPIPSPNLDQRRTRDLLQASPNLSHPPSHPQNLPRSLQKSQSLHQSQSLSQSRSHKKAMMNRLREARRMVLMMHHPALSKMPILRNSFRRPRRSLII